MKIKKIIFYVMTVVMLLSMTVGVALAEDGILFRKNISKTPDNETEKANIMMMDFYVPAQAADGTVGPVANYELADGTSLIGSTYESRDYAKPLITVWIDDLTHELEAKGGISFGKFDAFAGVSLDDGTTWKTTNLSRSADLSSFNLHTTGEAYPGDVHNVVHQVAGDQIFIAWASKYCDGGSPQYSLVPEDNIEYFNYLHDDLGLDAVYLYDLFGVSGAQGSVDYELQGFPEIGEIPYSCIWTERGKLIAGDDPSTDGVTELTHVVWTKPERLTSGKRDANLPAVDCAPGAGCILTWQEDPEGLRPGQGLGPGEGWSGAIANAKTDIWYSYISYDDFDDVYENPDLVDYTETNVVPIELYTGENMPKAVVPMAMPARLTDNGMCKYANSNDPLKMSDPYCYIDFDTIDTTVDPTTVTDYLEGLDGPEDGSDFCADFVEWDTGGTSSLDICVTEDGRVLNGRVASTRVRLNLKPYTTASDLDEDGELDKSAWVVMAYEEIKALGDVLIDPLDPESEPIDIGKDVWYHSFDMFDHDFIAQGGILNQPAVCKDEEDPFCSNGVGQFYDTYTDTLNGGEIYLSEIARRFAVTTNSISAAMASESKLSAMLIYKQGIINQGGPADIFLRRVILPDEFDPAVDNPYAYENMECGEWEFTDGSNPNYLKGICLAPAINLSGTTIVDCGGDGTDNDSCAAAFPVLDDGSNPDGDPSSFPKVYEWRQLPYEASVEGGDSFIGDPNDDSDLDDQSWENPYDVSKGHRGFLDGDIVMMMYAWSPNWNSNAVGNDHYNLYVRRSFDGGVTWTTTPSDLEGWYDDETDGAGVNVTEFYYGESIGDPAPIEFSYAAGADEQARNVSMLTGNKVTVLDPRYTPSGGLKQYSTIRTDWLEANTDILGFTSDDVLPYDDDLERAKDKFFVVYETGDNTTVATGEATPLDLYYSRGTIYGDIYELLDYSLTPTTNDDDFIEERWPWLENQHDDLSGEAGVVSNPGATFMYAVWNQWQETLLEDGHEEIHDSDIIFRRLFYNELVAADPTASFLYLSPSMVSTDADDMVTLVITAKDQDRLGDGLEITEYEWSIDGTVYAGCDSKQCNVPARTLSNGWDGFGNQAGSGGYGSHDFSVRVKDNDPNQERPEEMGNWSNQIHTSFMVVEVIYKVQLPFLTR